MKERQLRINHAIVRFDKVPHKVTSTVLARTCVPHYGDILDFEYTIRRNITVDVFNRKLRTDLENWLGAEIRRLREYGLSPVLYMGFFSWHVDFLNVRVAGKTIVKMARQGRSATFSFDSKTVGDVLKIVIPQPLIALLSEYEFTLEISS